MENKNSDSDADFETVLYREIGHFGKYQVYTIFLLLLVAIFSACMAGEYIFTAASIKHRCFIPECDGDRPEFEPEWLSNAIPRASGGFDNCYRYQYVNQTDITDLLSPDEVCPAERFNKNIITACDVYIYENTNTVVYDFNLECKEWLRTLPGTLNSLGGMVALAMAGYVSDYLGRRISVVLFSFNIALIGLIRAFSVNYGMYVALQFLQTALGGGAFSAGYILAAEIVGPKYRVRTSATMSTAFAFGQVVLGAIASLVNEWRQLSLVLFSPVFIIMSYYWILSESPRWLLSKHKTKAESTVRYAARLNGKKIDDKDMNFLLTAIPKVSDTNDENNENLFKRVIKSPVMLRRCCTTPFLWITTVFIYYGLSINSVNLSGNMYINYIATAAIEIPGYWTAVLVLDKIGRRITLFLGFMICAICCAAFAFTPSNMYELSLFLYLTGKYCIGAVMTSLYLFTAELYPTKYRHSFLGFSSMLGRIGSVVAPLTPPLMVYWTGIPSMMFAGMAFISSFLVLTQPETKGLKVPDTMEDAELLGKYI